MFNKIRATLATVMVAAAILAAATSPAHAATTPIVVQHATTQAGLQAELAAHPLFIKGTTSFTPEQLLAMPLELRAQSQCVGAGGAPSYSLCVWIDPNYTGSFYNWNTYWLNFCVPVGDPFRNAVSSGWNNMPGYHYNFFDNMGCNSKLFGWNYNSKGNFDWASDRMESFEGHYGNN